MTHFVRRATVIDIDDMLLIAVRCYPPFDVNRAREWGEKCMFDPKFAFFRTDDAWGVVSATEVFFDDKLRGMMLYLAARPGAAYQCVDVLEAMVEWARGQGAVTFSFGEDTGMRMDVLAKRLHSRLRKRGLAVDTARPSWRIELVQKSPLVSFWTKAA